MTEEKQRLAASLSRAEQEVLVAAESCATAQEIADATGRHVVYVYRVLKALEDDGLLVREDPLPTRWRATVRLATTPLEAP